MNDIHFGSCYRSHYENIKTALEKDGFRVEPQKFEKDRIYYMYRKDRDWETVFF